MGWVSFLFSVDFIYAHIYIYMYYMENMRDLQAPPLPNHESFREDSNGRMHSKHGKQNLYSE